MYPTLKDALMGEYEKWRLTGEPRALISTLSSGECIEIHFDQMIRMWKRLGLETGQTGEMR